MKVFEKLEDYVNSENKKYYLYIFYDVDSTTEEFIRESVKLNEGATIRKVQPSTMRIESL